jgi:crotonobetainyl-CoA:carnitine CoA-transferase CaiB-like acyl-CoA transferase
MQTEMESLFKDLVVIDAASFVAGPGAATIFADFGARVIKVEAPAGDAYRLLHGRHRFDFNWALTSRHKEAISVDLNTEAGRDILHQLIQTADIFVHNFRSDQIDRYDVAYERLRGLNPRLIYGQLTGFGTKGPDADKRGYDTTAWWSSAGILDLMKKGQTAPNFPVGGVGDHASAMTLFAGITMALYQREKTGLGDAVETSLVANGAWSNGMHLQGAIAGFDLSKILEEKGYRSPFAMIYETADHRFLVLVSPNPDKEWPAIARALGHPEWLEDPRFVTLRAIMKQRDEVRQLFQDAIGALTMIEACQALDAESLSYSVIEKISEVVQSAQLIENEVIIETHSEDPDFQWTVANPIKLSSSTHRPVGDPPKLGEHTYAILKDLGLSEARIDELIASKVVRLSQAVDPAS